MFKANKSSVWEGRLIHSKIVGTDQNNKPLADQARFEEWVVVGKNMQPNSLRSSSFSTDNSLQASIWYIDTKKMFYQYIPSDKAIYSQPIDGQHGALASMWATPFILTDSFLHMTAVKDYKSHNVHMQPTALINGQACRVMQVLYKNDGSSLTYFIDKQTGLLDRYIYQTKDKREVFTIEEHEILPITESPNDIFSPVYKNVQVI